ncbi:transglycosylase SLT domain-containing protein [Spirosoma pomorum]
MKALLLFLLLISSAASANAPDLPTAPGSLIYSELIPADYRAQFEAAVIASASRLKVQPDWLMVCMRFETAGTFRANTRNKYSGAVGLIQFLPTTAKRLGTTPNKLAAMTAVDQLLYVERYFQPYAGRMTDVYDVYLVIFAPAFLGRRHGQVLYRADDPTPLGRRRYHYNRVLDDNRDGVITIRDVKRQIRRFVPKPA